jgi:hypothetical protein
MKQLVDIGDPKAPPGSEPWCRAFHVSLCDLKHKGQFAVSNLKYSLKEFQDGKYFERLMDNRGKPFREWKAFVECREPYGLGLPIKVADAVMNAPNDAELLRDVMDQHGGDRRSEKAKDQVANSHLKSNSLSSTSIERILRRLRRDRPELAKQVEAGKISARQAAKKAGFASKHRCPKCGHQWW